MNEALTMKEYKDEGECVDRMQKRKVDWRQNDEIGWIGVKENEFEGYEITSTNVEAVDCDTIKLEEITMNQMVLPWIYILLGSWE